MIQDNTMKEHLKKLETENSLLQDKLREWETTLRPYCNSDRDVPIVADLVSLISKYEKKKNNLVLLEEKLTKTEEQLKFAQQQKDSTKMEGSKLIQDKPKDVKIQRLENALSLSTKKLTESEAMVICLERKNQQILKLLEKTEKEACHMESQLARGVYNPRDTKVLHVAFNPEKQARKQVKQAKINELLEENERLKKQISMMREHGRGKVPLVPYMDEADKENCIQSNRQSLSRKPLSRKPLSEKSISQKDDDTTEKIRKLEAEMNQERIKMDRMKKIWHQKVTEFREACYELTGYKIDMKKDKQFLLRSMYAERESDHLLFCRNRQGFLQVLETDFCKTLEPSTLAILQQKNSIPAFVSQITMDLFSQMTQY